MAIHTNLREIDTKYFGFPPVTKNKDGSIQHVYCDGARFHVKWWDSEGTHCTEKDCEINRDRKRMNKERKHFGNFLSV